MGGGSRGRTDPLTLVEESPLRCADPRTKLLLCLTVSLAVMLPLEKLLAVLVLYTLFLGWARLLPQAARQVWRLKWVLLFLFVIDWVMVGSDLAVIVVLRLILLAGVFALFVHTTTPCELRLALEALRVPYRYAFSLSLAFQSVDSMRDEWQGILEAQRARGAFDPDGSATRSRARWRERAAYVGSLVALTVPAIVLTARRAWAMTEAAYARGFGSPHRSPYRRLRMGWLDGFLISATAVAVAALLWWR